MGKVVRAHGFENETMLKATRNVPRHEFVPDDVRRLAHHDTPLRSGMGRP